MADEEASLLQTARALPCSERVAHKNWKVRAEAFDDLKSTCERVFSSDDPQLSSIGEGLSVRNARCSSLNVRRLAHRPEVLAQVLWWERVWVTPTLQLLTRHWMPCMHTWERPTKHRQRSRHPIGRSLLQDISRLKVARRKSWLLLTCLHASFAGLPHPAAP